MEHCEGETLATRLGRGPLPIDQVLRYAIEIASALDAAHRAGIVHRDLKPGNIMLTKSGAKLLDFGLAKAGAPFAAGAATLMPTTPAGLTAQGTILGTLQYMAPEQLEGRDADARSDIFAFGTLLYEMVTGRKAFEAKSQASLIAKILETAPPSMASLQPVTPASLEHLVRRCLAKNADERWQTANDLCQQLKWIADSSSAHAIAPAIARPAERRSFKTILVGGLAVAACVIRCGTSMRLSTPPSDSASWNSFVAPATRAASSGDSARNETIPPKFRICFAAVVWPGWCGRPG